jgi:CheY-like chemotaxis protein
VDILVLEDQASVAHGIEKVLIEKGHSVYSAFSVRAGQAYLCDNDIDCIIVDLNLGSEDLNEEEKKETQGEVLTGWVWLDKYVIQKNLIPRERIIILTGFLDEFKKYVSREKRKQIVLIRKKGEYMDNNLVPAVEKIESTLKKEEGNGRQRE